MYSNSRNVSLPKWGIGAAVRGLGWLVDSGLGAWLLVSLALSLVFFRDFWTGLPAMLSRIFQFNAGPWGVLLLCFLFLWVKRREIHLKVAGETGAALARILAGGGLAAGAVLMPAIPEYLVFRVLLQSLGIFVAFFGRAARIPAIILGVYAFAVSFPLAVEAFFADGYARTVLVPLLGIMERIGLPVQSQGAWISMESVNGDPIRALVTVACAGPVTMGVFIALFTLMTLDRPLPPKKALGMFLFGVAGTWFQSLLRLVILLVAAYFFGNSGLWTAHYWTIYILFPLWYLAFAFIYFRRLRATRKRGITPKPGTGR